MKCVVHSSLVSFSALGFAAIAALPAAAQFVAIPISNGSFALQGTGGATGYVNPATPMTLLSPAGTINITNVPLPQAAVVPASITTNTPVGMYFENVGGSTSLNDGRSGSFTAGYLKLQSLGNVTGAASSPMLPVDTGVRVDYTVLSGSLAVPEVSLSAYPTGTVSIPISNAAFTINVPTTGEAGTVTINSILTPAGTANLTLTIPDLGSTPGIGDLFLNGPNQAIRMHAIANGTIALNNGNVATVDNRVVTLTGTASLTSGPAFWYGEQIPGTPATVDVTITGGSINVPQSAVALPAPPTVPTPPTGTLPPSQPNQPTQPVTAPISDTGGTSTAGAANAVTAPVVVSRPTPIVAPPVIASVSLGFANNVNLGNQSDDLLQQLAQASQPKDLPEVDESPLNISRIHAGLRSQ